MMDYELIESKIPIKSCPFCGTIPKGVDRWLVNRIEKIYHYSVSCEYCKIEKVMAVNTFSYLDLDTAVKIWNHRV
jgi:hypothetical protein